MDNNIEVVIKIPKGMRDMCKWHRDGICDLVNLEIDILAEAIVNATVLPEGHDDLIERAQVTNYDNLYDVPTVIEANKEVN